MDESPLSAAASRIQYPNVPKEAELCRTEVPLLSVTRRSDSRFTTGAEMVVTSKRMLATKRKSTPTLRHDKLEEFWKNFGLSGDWLTNELRATLCQLVGRRHE